LAAEGAEIAAPVLDADQAPYDVLATHLDAMSAGQGAAALLSGLELDLPVQTAAAEAAGPTLWAHQPSGDLAALLQSVAPVDISRAQLARSYWWSPGGTGRASVWLGCPGLPGAQALGWLLAGVAPQEVSDEQ
jgi:type VI secretion system protein ImpM